MVAGILFQLAATAIFAVLATDFMYRVVFNKPYAFRERQLATAHSKALAKAAREASETAAAENTLPEGTAADSILSAEPKATALEHAETDRADLRGTQLLLAGVAFATLMIVIRGIYRSIELLQGWSGYIITHEVSFLGAIIPRTRWC